jgi:dihydrofolate synthase/folylpolyglutamate synthase
VNKNMTAAECRSYLRHLERFGVKLGLDNIRVLLRAFDDPQSAYPCIHVAGTNGKGSVCAMMAQALERNGLRAGMYTSPHLARVEERIRVDGKLIAGAAFRRIVGEVKAKSEALLANGGLEAPPTFFEVLTAVAMLSFREKKVDIAIFEVGMGGRFDATNVVTPLVSVITNIALDHQDYLGDTLRKIAFEKAGIIKPGVPVVTGAESETALKVIRARARDCHAPLVEAFGKEGRLEAAKAGRPYRFVFRFEGDVFRFTPGLTGAHQAKNAAVALAALSVLGMEWRPLESEKMVEGIENARWEGRLELVSKRPRFYLDGAHNEAGVEALRAFIRGELKERPILVFTMMKDKAIASAVRLLFPEARKIVLTSIPYDRAAEPAGILALAGPFRRKIIVEPSLPKALALAKREAGPHGVVLAAGSLYLVGAVKKLLR